VARVANGRAATGCAASAPCGISRYAEDALLRHVMETNEDIAKRTAALQGLPELATRTERIALGELVAAAVDARRARDEQALLERLKPFASDVRVDPPGGERVALNAQLLVPRDRRVALDDAVRQLGSALQGYLALRYIGPPADHRAASTPTKNSTPAVPRLAVMDSIGPWNVLAEVAGPSSGTVCR
jgi:hypothetical protein